MILTSKLFLSPRYAKYFFILFFSILLNCEHTNRADNKGKEVVNNNDSGVFTDLRDNQPYNWIRLKDGKKWMTENLNYKTTDSWHYQNSNDYAKYGRLYTWQSAQKACPSGWRLPSDDEWWKMTSYYSNASNSQSGQQLNEEGDAGKAAYKALMQEGNSGFSALLGGYRLSDDDFSNLGKNGNYWSGSEQSSSYAWTYFFRSNYKLLLRNYGTKSWGFSCRCIQD